VVLIIVCTYIGWRITKHDGSLKYPMPDVTQFDPISIAYLRDGINAVINTALFSLWSSQLLEIEPSKSLGDAEPKSAEDYDIQSKVVQKIPLSPIEEEINKSTLESQRSIDLFKDRALKRRIKKHLKPLEKELDKYHLMRTNWDNLKAIIITIIALSIILYLGVAKLAMGLANDRPVSYLIGLIIVSIYLEPWLLIFHGKQSQLGKEYIKILVNNYGWLRRSFENWKFPWGIDPSYPVAVFGISELDGPSFFVSFVEALTLPRGSVGFWEGGCGGCGGCGCGGGCGGCGG
jgi:uncharacterized protein (TIGR04222 family)